MREIKFRAWDKEKKRFVNFDTHDELFINPLTGKITEDCDNSCGDPECCGGPSPCWCDQDRYILMQYTGLKDKNGVEIYCSDIVKRIHDVSKEKDINKVSFMKGSFYFGTELLGFCGSCEIIGNIYESPELLNK